MRKNENSLNVFAAICELNVQFEVCQIASNDTPTYLTLPPPPPDKIHQQKTSGMLRKRDELQTAVDKLKEYIDNSDQLLQLFNGKILT